MTPPCPHEIEVVAALVERRDDSEVLTVHAEVCEACREVVMVTRAMAEERDAARREIRLPAAGQVWWRAAVRARLEAVHAAARPLTWLHGAAGAAACGLLVAVVGLVWPFVRETAAWLIAQAVIASSIGEAALRIGGALQPAIPIILVAGVCLVLAPLALYFALSDE